MCCAQKEASELKKKHSQVALEELRQKDCVIQAWWAKSSGKFFCICEIQRNNQKFCSYLITLSLKGFLSGVCTQNCDGRGAKAAAMQILLVRKCQVAKRYSRWEKARAKWKERSRIPLVAINSSAPLGSVLLLVTKSLTIPWILLLATSRI